jgi:hypothetical protein
MTFSYPLLDAISVEDVLIVADQSGHHLVFMEVTPADRTLFPKSIFVAMFCLSLLLLESCPIKRKDDFWNR